MIQVDWWQLRNSQLENKNTNKQRGANEVALHRAGQPADPRADLGESALSGGPRHLARRQEDSAAGRGTHAYLTTLTHLLLVRGLWKIIQSKMQ